MYNKPEDQIHMLCEQGDMGLWDTELTESDQKKLKEMDNKETVNKNKE